MVDSTMWIGFLVLVAFLLLLDLGLFNKGSKHISTRKAIYLTLFWISLAIAFGVFVYFTMGSAKGVEYFTAYIIEKAMSVDNLFVFIIIFAFFAIPDEYQHKALFYGIIGALVFRAIFIFAGAELMNNFNWMMYVFGAFLVIIALKTMFKKEGEENNKTAVWISKVFRSSPELDGGHLTTIYKGARVATPLLLCIIVIELTDIVFAIDSIPAVLAISTDTFIIYTSNIFAILGLRSLYFAIHGSLNSLRYLKYGLGIILAFVGVKLLISGFYHIDIPVSLGFILGVLLITIVASLIKAKPAE